MKQRNIEPLKLNHIVTRIHVTLLNLISYLHLYYKK